MIFCGARQDRTMLTQQLQRLGVTPVALDPTCDPTEEQDFDLAFIDVEGGRATLRLETLLGRLDVPVLALLGSDAPSSVDWAIEQGVSGYIFKPIRGAGILASLVIACHAFEERRANVRTIAELRRRLKARQLVCTAALRVVDCFHVTEKEAFQVLQVCSMERRVSVEDLAAMIVSGELATPALGVDIKNRIFNVGESQ
jgi:AmiR/NasT family two-component response regulator